jgi:hypothetical protein
MKTPASQRTGAIDHYVEKADASAFRKLAPNAGSG